MSQESRIRQLLESTPFPGAGEKLGDILVKESIVDIEGRNWEIHLEGKHSPLRVRKALRQLTKYPHSVDIEGQFSVLSFKGKGMSHVRTNPPGDLTVVRGHMYYARPNPTTPKAFQEEMDEMITDEPEKFFTVHKATGDKSLKDKLWSFVTYTGESYGWYKDGEIYHRRASIIMPKIKINKALEGATMFYHTHPHKDEPSLTSADDIQFYLDLHFAFGIKTFYTVMKHKMDKFTITGKKSAEAKYLKHDEEKFVDAVDGLIAIGEESSKKNLPKDAAETDHQNHVTRVMVQEFNKKYGSIATIKFTPSVKKNAAKKLARKSPLDSLMALSNPRPNPPIVLEDKYVAKALEELQGLDYAFEHYGGDEYAHTMYVYWWLKHHLYPTKQYPKGRLFKLQEYGMDQDTRVKLREYLNTTVLGNYNYLDVVMLIGLYHDIAKLREKQPGAKPGHIIGADMFRNEVAPELNLPSKLTEDIAHILESDVGRKGITDEQFLMQSGHYYAAAKLMQMADVVTHHPLMFTGSARKAKAEGKIGMASGQKYKDYAMTEIVNDIRDFLDHGDVPRQNPPPKATVVRWVGNYNQEFSMEIVEVNLEEFDYRNVPNKDGDLGEKQGGIGGHLFYMRFDSSLIPSIPEGRVITANLALNTGNLLITIGSPVPQDDLGKQIANDIYVEVGLQLKASYPDLVVEEPEPEMLVNPMLSKKIQLITLSGPSGVGKSTVLKFLANNLPNASTPPTYTTRPRRPTDGQDRVHISKEKFMDGVQRGEFVEWTKSNNGHFYGKKFKDFTGDVAIIDVTIGGKKKYEKSFPNMFSIFLEPDPNISAEQRAKKLYQRGGMSKEEAKKRASISQSMVDASKKMDFDLRMVMKHGDYEKNAERILGEIPLNNPNLGDFGDIGETPEERAERDLRLAAEKARIEAEEEEENRERREREESLVDEPMSEHLGQTLEEREAEEQARLDRKAEERRQREEEEERNRAQTSRLDAFENPKSLFEWFYDWVHLVNMKNKELKAFLDSDWGKVAGLSKQEAKDWNNIKSGRVSGRRILKMRKKLGLTGPKDYIKLGPRIIEDYYEKALDKWTGPSNDMQKGETDWDWCKRQVRFNKRFMGDHFGKRKGALVKKQKTQNQPSRRLLSLWVWGHDPWRYARKVEKRAKMPKCPDVPWVGMTEKRKYGKIPVIMSPRARSNPVFKKKRECPPPQKKGITIYGAEWCHWCGEAKKYLDKQGIEYKYVDIDKVKNYQKVIYPLTKNYPYVPVIFIDGKFIGGYSELTTRSNPGFRDPETGKRVVILDENLPSKKYHGTTELPYRLPYGLVKGLRSLLAREREYVGFVKNNRIYYSTSFEKGSTTSRGSEDLVGALLKFHTHPYGYRKGMQGMVSTADLASALYVRWQTGITWSQVVVQKRGINFIATLLKENSPLDKAYDAKDWDKCNEEVEKDAEKLMNIYRGESLLRFYDISGHGHPHWHASTEYGQEKALIETANEIMDNFEFFMYYLEVPAVLPDWKEGVTEDFTLEGKKFEDVVKKFKPGIYKQIRSNPHYTPPPGIAMFPGEMPRGPAALYQQTISISQLQGLQRVSPSVLANGRRGRRRSRSSVTKQYRSQYKRTNHRYCDRTGKQIFPDNTSCLRDIRDQKKRDIYLPEMTCYGPCQYCGGWHKTSKVRGNPPPRPHDADAIRTIVDQPWGPTLNLECPICGLKGGVEMWMENECNHAYPSCGHILRINPDKPCCCEKSEFPPAHPSHWPNTRDSGSGFSLRPPSGFFDNPRTKKGRKFPKKYLKNLTPTEKAIAMYEIDRGYEYDEDDPEAYKFWESDIKSKARGLKTVPSKWRNKFAKKYGPLKEGKDFLTRISKTTGIKRSILKKIYDKGLAAWRVGHRPGVQQHQWAAGRVYAFVMGADSSTGPGKPDHKLAVEAGVR